MSGQEPPDPWQRPGAPPPLQPQPYPAPWPPQPPAWGGQPYAGQQPPHPTYPPAWSTQPYSQWSSPQPWQPPTRRPPAKVLYAIPAVLGLAAVALLVTFFGTRTDEVRVATHAEHVGTTDGGVAVEARPGWHYDVYLPDTSDEPTVSTCTFHTDPTNASVDVDDSTSGSDYFTDGNGRDWTQVGSIVAPTGANGRMQLTCTGFSGPIDVHADDSMIGWMLLVIAVSGALALAGVGVLVLLLVLRHSARRPGGPTRPPAPGYGYAGW